MSFGFNRLVPQFFSLRQIPLVVISFPLQDVAPMKRIVVTCHAPGLYLSAGGASAQDAQPNTLTDAEKAAGWKLLFNGKDYSGWHNFKRQGVRPGWQVKDGALVCVDPHNAGDIVSPDQYEWFELQIDYNISEAGNSGIMYHVTDEGNAAWATGPEFQLEDNVKAADQHPMWLAVRALPAADRQQDRQTAGCHQARRRMEPYSPGH